MLEMNCKSANVQGTDSILDHPILLSIPLVTAFLSSALATDLTFWATSDPFWASASLWLIEGGLVTGLLAASTSFTDFVASSCAPRPAGWLHFLGTGLVLILALSSFLLRLGNPEPAVQSIELILSIMTVAILLAMGWVGEELAYRFRNLDN